MAFTKSDSLIFSPYLVLRQLMLSYALKYRNAFNEVLECNLEYHYGSLGVLKNNETEKAIAKKRNKVKYSYDTTRDAYHVPYTHY